jgi:hypothetical protein
MQDNLNLSPGYLKFITDLSKDRRHGAVIGVRISDIEETRIRAWNVATRFIEFRKHGNTKLPDYEFPLK